MRLIDIEDISLLKMIGAGRLSAKALWRLIKAQPIVDAVPVIRCRDCKHRDPEDKKCDCGHDITWQLPRDDDWYCADAERKEE